MTSSVQQHGGLFDASVFESLQQKIDEDIAVRDALREIAQTLEKQDRATQAVLSQAHSTSRNGLTSIISAADACLHGQIQSIARLSEQASRYPYYKYNGMWSRQMQDTTFSILLIGYLRSYADQSIDATSSATAAGGRLLNIEEVGTILNVPVNLKDRDAFHLTIEEYLHAVISLIDELARFSRNAVTLQDHAAPLAIARFIKNLHAGFQLLNLKNDALRKRSDGVKYRVKEVEDVVYDLSLRGLVKNQ